MGLMIAFTTGFIAGFVSCLIVEGLRTVDSTDMRWWEDREACNNPERGNRPYWMGDEY